MFFSNAENLQVSSLLNRPPKLQFVSQRQRRCLVAWWGALDRGGETVGDLRALQNVARLLRNEGLAVVLATKTIYRELQEFRCVDWTTLEPDSVDVFVFVCGPIIGDSQSFREIHERFADSVSIAVGVSLLPASTLSAWNPFTHVIARDGGDGPAYGDLSLFERSIPRRSDPVRRVGLCLRGAQREYGLGESLHVRARQIADSVLEIVGGEVVDLDTRLHGNAVAADEIEAAFASVDLVVTTRMHGALLGISKGKPTLAIDQISYGGKVSAVVRQIGWPAVISANAGERKVSEIVEFLLSSQVVHQLERAQNAVKEAHDLACQAICKTVHQLAQMHPVKTRV